MNAPSFSFNPERSDTRQDKAALYNMLMADIRDFESRMKERKERLSSADQAVLDRMRIEATSLGRQLNPINLKLVKPERAKYSKDDAQALYEMLMGDLADFRRDLDADKSRPMSVEHRKRLAELEREAKRMVEHLGLTPRNDVS